MPVSVHNLENRFFISKYNISQYFITKAKFKKELYKFVRENFIGQRDIDWRIFEIKDEGWIIGTNSAASAFVFRCKYPDARVLENE